MILTNCRLNGLHSLSNICTSKCIIVFFPIFPSQTVLWFPTPDPGTKCGLLGFFKCSPKKLKLVNFIVIRYVCMMSTLFLVEIYNAEHPIAGQDKQHHTAIIKDNLLSTCALLTQNTTIPFELPHVQKDEPKSGKSTIGDYCQQEVIPEL